MSMAMDVYAVMSIIFGLVIGSFLNVCIYRIPRGLSIVTPGSSCPGCGHMITPLENIPVLSFLVLRGKCRQCKTKISWRYPLVEILTAVLFYMTYLKTGFNIDFVLYLTVVASFIAIAFIDYDTLRIPDIFLIPGFITGLTFTILYGWFDYLIGGVGLIVFFLGVRVMGKVLFRKEAMGLGDVKLAGIIGFFLGWQNGLVAVFMAFIIASLFSLLLISGSRIKFGKAIPFGPFLSIGTMISLLYGDFLVNWYVQLFIY